MGGGPRPWKGNAVKATVVAVDGENVTVNCGQPVETKVGDECVVVFPTAGSDSSGAVTEP